MKVLHHFVDPAGRTHMDEFDCPYALGGLPDSINTCHVFISQPYNSNQIRQLHEELLLSRDSAVLLACPPGYTIGSSGENARVMIRRLCFDRPSPWRGGFRRPNTCDIVTAQIVSRTIEHRKKAQEYSAHEMGACAVEMSTFVSGHPLWRRVHWIEGLYPALFAWLLTDAYDPTWFVPEDGSASGSRFVSRFSQLADADARDIMLSLVFNKVFKLADGGGADAISGPGAYFTRCGAHVLDQALVDGSDPVDAFFSGAAECARHVANYVWLNWIELTHPDLVPGFDERRYFPGDECMQKFVSRAIWG